MNEEILGQNSNFFIGVVESREDPDLLGRVKVRIFGLHDENKTVNESTGRGIKTEDLPWAHPVNSIQSATLSGLGTTPHQLIEGTHVVGVSLDGDFYNNLLILGTIGGIHKEKPSNNKGFADPGGNFPLEERIDEPDTNRLARNERIEETILQWKNEHLDDEIGEPESKFDVEYPFNKTFESESGHIFEIDDTKDAERLNWHHKANTFKEIHPDGTVVYKIQSDNYEIVAGKNNVHIEEKSTEIYGSDLDITVKGNITINTYENVEVDAGGNASVNAGGNVTVETENGNATVTGGSKLTLYGGNVDILTNGVINKRKGSI